MKKVLAICLTAVLVLCMSVTVFAAPDGFVSSPSANPAPIVITFTSADDDCTAKLIITPYNERHEMTEVLRTMFEKAYSDIVNAADLTKLNDQLAKAAAEKNIASDKLAVGDLFDIHVTGCDYHEGHEDFDVTLDADTLSHFVGLLHMNKDGVWEWVSDAKVVNNGEHLVFSVDSFSPFAIVVDASEGVSNTPQAGEKSMVHVYVIIMVISALAIVLIAVKSKKKSTN